ncbi:hypothetical protein RIE95_03430 [Acidithiobacillus thiooxidans]|jgi:prefoldin subunit 5|uniref:hypothetical protein n=1 Tax=Acidithiobacillus thiooxidans TaxID=930 RepID=UPI002866A756|nr:hypothetical protein [Acidithiobacillus thiooxidans]MDR7926053.1 hypothetical protein [Acidithiobacillus thiooxidans]
MSGSRKRPPRAVIEKDFDDAIDRLEKKKPKDPLLKRLAAEGRLQINFSTVAKEAEHSRTLIAHSNCQYQSQRARVLQLMRPGEVTAPRTASEVITRLREDVAELKSKLHAALSGQTAHFLARQRAEREAERWRKEAQRRESLLKERDKLHRVSQNKGGE